MRKKSEMENRDRYSRLYAAVRAAESLIQFRLQKIVTVITVEAEDNEFWDDIVEEDEAGNRHRRQVKRQFTPLSATDFSPHIVAAASGGLYDTYSFAYPVPIEVDGVGELRILSGLSDRAQQDGANADRQDPCTVASCGAEVAG